VTVTLTRQNLEAAVYCSKNDRFHFLRILICLCGRSTEQVPAGVLDMCGIVTVNNNINNNNNIYNNRVSPSKSLQIISYIGDRLMRSHTNTSFLLRHLYL